MRALFGWTLTLETARIDHPAHNTVLVSSGQEPYGNADFHDSLAVFLHWGTLSQGSNDVFYLDLLAPGGQQSLSYSLPEDHEPSIFNGIVAWREGLNDIYIADVFDPFGPVPTLITHGTQPDGGDGFIVTEDQGLLQVSDTSTFASDWYASAYGNVSWPSAGGDIIAYNAGSDVAYRDRQDIHNEKHISGPCAAHSYPRVNLSGTIVLHTGTNCPSGHDGIFITYLHSDDSQDTYKLDNLRGPTAVLPRHRYSIGTTSVGYIINNNIIKYVELVP